MSAPEPLARHRKPTFFGPEQIDRIPQLSRLGAEARDRMKAVSAVLPFRVNAYVLDELIDWDAVPDDPIFQLTFPQPGMLDPSELGPLIDLVRAGDKAALRRRATIIQRSLNPHPAGQLTHNVPAGVEGLQHKYRETVLFFPRQGQTCHAYCGYCFRWAQFVGVDRLALANGEPAHLAAYVRAHPEVTSVLLTGGDPLIMRTRVLRRYVEPLLQIEHVRSIRLGTKSLAYWPQRFVTDPDADDLCRLFEEVTHAGKQLAVMGHYSHWRELTTPMARAALRRTLSTGASVRTQAPLIRHVNDSPAVWRRLWQDQVQLGAFPYYLFVERDTGARRYFEVPLAQALEIYESAYRGVSGLARTARGPVMSSMPGKVLIDGVTQIGREKVFVLKLLQARDPAWVNRPFFARFDPTARWLDDLRPALGHDEWFWERPLAQRLGEPTGRDRPFRDITLNSFATFGGE